MSSKEKLRRLGFSKFINIGVNEVVKTLIDREESFKDCHQFSGVMRFDSKDKIKFPKYKMIVLIDNIIYCYNKFKYGVIDLNSYCNKIEFNSNEESASYWNKYIKMRIINNCIIWGN